MADVSMATFTHRVRLHFRSVANTAVSFYNILALPAFVWVPTTGCV